MLGLWVLLCMGALHRSHGLASPAELTATIFDRYPYDLKSNPCDMRLPYSEIGWYKRMMPLKTHQRTMRDLDVLGQIASLVEPAGVDGQGRAVPSTAQTDSYTKKIQAVLAHNTTLPEDALRRSLVHTGEGTRLNRLFNKVLTGQDIAAVMLGGSISAGADTHSYKTESFFAQTTAWLESLSPSQANNTFLNLAKGATESTFYAHCLHDTLPEDLAVDLVVIEFAINDMRWDARVTPYMQNSKRRGLEVLIRKLLLLPSRPAVLMLNLWMPAFNRYSFWEHNAEEEMELLGKYYDLDILSWRNAIHPLLFQERPGFKECTADGGAPRDFMCSRIHPNLVGHTYIADLIIGWMQNRMASMLVDQWLNPGAGAAAPADAAGSQEAPLQLDATAPDWQLPAPMLLDAKESENNTCFQNTALQQQVVGNQGWAWEDLVTAYGSHKAGYVSSRVGDIMDIKVDTAVDDRPKYSAMIGVGVLKSHAPMGVLRISCASGCTCAPLDVDCRWEQKISVRQFVYFNAACHPDCVLRFENADTANSTARESHRLKLDTIVVMGSVDSQAYTDNANLMWQANSAHGRRRMLGADEGAAGALVRPWAGSRVQADALKPLTLKNAA